uniref:Sleeping Beauty transposase HTH domain-containing protein n=1 Tax=Oncorhynchus tshawytscha TaxID=74940 RepID=A0AAZ3PE19_ONCTS
MRKFVELRDRIMSRHRSGHGYENISAALKVPKNTVASIILKWKKFGTTKTLPRARRPAKQSNRGRRALVRKVTKNPVVTDRAPEFLCGDGRTFQNSLCSTPPNQAFMVEWSEGNHSSVKGTAARLEFAKRHLKDSQTMRNKILWYKETKIELFGLNAKLHAEPELGLEPNQTSLERPDNSCTVTLPSNLRELKRICKEWEKLPKYRCAKLVASYPRRLEAKIAAKRCFNKVLSKGSECHI